MRFPTTFSLCLALFLGGVLPPAHAQSFTEADLEGSFAFQTFGTGREPAGTIIHASEAMTGVFKSDGAGRIFGGMLYSQRGGPGVYSHSFSGTYTLQPDGTGFMELAGPGRWSGSKDAASTARWTFVLIDESTVLFTGTTVMPPAPTHGGYTSHTHSGHAYKQQSNPPMDTSEGLDLELKLSSLEQKLDAALEAIAALKSNVDSECPREGKSSAGPSTRRR